MNRSRLVKPNTWQMSTNFKCHCLAFMFVFALKHTHSLRNVRKYMELSWSKTNNTIDKTAVSITQRIILKLVFLQSRYYLHFDRMKWKRDKKKKTLEKKEKEAKFTSEKWDFIEIWWMFSHFLCVFFFFWRIEFAHFETEICPTCFEFWTKKPAIFLSWLTIFFFFFSFSSNLFWKQNSRNESPATKHVNQIFRNKFSEARLLKRQFWTSFNKQTFLNYGSLWIFVFWIFVFLIFFFAEIYFLLLWIWASIFYWNDTKIK